MAMITCPECKKKISESAESCPNCGFRLTAQSILEAKKAEQKAKKGCQIGCLVLVAIVAVVVLIGYMSGPPDLPTGPTKIDAFVMSQTFVERQLKSPASADFCSFSDATVSSLGNGKFQVIAYVDAQNSFGAQIRNYYICVLHSDNGTTWTLDDLHFQEQ